MAEQRILTEAKEGNIKSAAWAWTVLDTQERIEKSLLNKRSLWGAFVDWVQESPTGRWVLAIMGLLLVFIPTILVVVAYYFSTPTSTLIYKLREAFISGKLEEKTPEDLKATLEKMNKSMRAEANIILEEYKQHMKKADVSLSLAQQAHAKIAGVLENIPDDFPFKQEFQQRTIPKKSDDNLNFKGEGGGTFSNDPASEGTSRKNANLINAFIQKTFDIELLEPRLEGGFKGVNTPGISGCYFCKLDSEKLTKIIALDSSVAVINAKQFYETWKVQSSITSTLKTKIEKWVPNGFDQEQLEKIKKKFLKLFDFDPDEMKPGMLSPIEIIFAEKMPTKWIGKFLIKSDWQENQNFDSDSQKKIIKETNEKYKNIVNTFKDYLNQKFGGEACLIEYENSSPSNKKNTQKRNVLTVTITLQVDAILKNKQAASKAGPSSSEAPIIATPISPMRNPSYTAVFSQKQKTPPSSSTTTQNFPQIGEKF